MRGETGVLFPLLLALACPLGCQRTEPAPTAAPHVHTPTAAPAPASRPAAQRWHCPMHPNYISDRPGDCPICGMKLVPIPNESGGTSDGAAAAPVRGLSPIDLDDAQQQRIGVKSVLVEKRPFAATIRTTGRVTFDETRVHHVHTRYEAYIEEVYADFVGKYVKRGEPLVALYSPELLAAEQEYLLALSSRQAGPGLRTDLVEAARQKLLLWNISGADIRELEHRGRPSQTLKLYAPASGYVVAKTAVHGMRVKPEDSLFDLVDLSHVWVLADIYEYELPRVAVGQAATMTVPFWPDRRWEGRVTYIFPSVDPKTRTVRVRLDVENPRGELKAEMFANVVLTVAPRQALLVPEDAVIETGTRKVVFVIPRQGRLEPREIETGDRADRMYEVRAGLSEGERVAVGASFLVDSEARLRSAVGEAGGGR